MLLPSNRIDHETELQPIEEDHANQIDSDTNSDANNKTLPLPEQVMESNWVNKLCSKIQLYLANLKGLDKSNAYLKGLRVENGLLMKRNQLWVANEGQLQLEVIKKIHNQPAVGYPGTERTLEMARRHYYWPGIKEIIQQFIRNCHVCKQAKAARDIYHSLLQLLPMLEQAWMNITMDFVVGLLKYKAYEQIYDAILIIINQLSKERHYIFCSEEDERTSVEATADLFLQDVWSKHGLPVSMMSNRGPQFVLKMWDSLCKLLGIKAKLSTAFHPEIDGQSENANQEAERHLQSYVNHFQDDWVRLLPMGEFSANANISATIKVPPFLATKGYNPRMSFDFVDLSANSTKERIANSTARSIANCMEEVWEFIQEEMIKSQAKQAVAANHHQKELLIYKIGDMVWLSTRNIKIERLSKKLDHKMIGPYKVKELVGSSYQLELLYTMKIYDVFHLNLLWKAADNPLPSQQNSLPPPTVVNNEEEWEVDDILNAKRGRGSKKVLFQVKWKRYDNDKAWYDATNFDHAQDIVDNFYKQNLTKPQ